MARQNSVQSNTLDQYFEAVGQVDSQKNVGLFEEEVRQEETDDEEDKFSEASGAYGIVESQIAQQISVSDPPGAHVHGMDGVPGEAVGEIVRHAEWHNTALQVKTQSKTIQRFPSLFQQDVGLLGIWAVHDRTTNWVEGQWPLRN